MVTRSPLLNGVEGTDRDAHMEAPRGEGVVELVLGSRRGLSGCVVVGTFSVSSRSPCGGGDASLPAGYRGPINSMPSAAILSETVRSRAGSANRLSSVAP